MVEIHCASYFEQDEVCEYGKCPFLSSYSGCCVNCPVLEMCTEHHICRKAIKMLSNIHFNAQEWKEDI